MQNLVSTLTQFNSMQTILMSITIIIGIVLIILTCLTFSLDIVSSAINLTIAFLALILFIFFTNQQNDAVKNHEYTAIRNEQKLEIESKSDMIKSHKFKIDSEDHDHIYIKTSSLFGTTNYIIDKSDINKNIINVN